MKRKHPDRKLTLRQAFDKHYDQTELRDSTKSLIHYTLLRWERLSGNPPLCKITNDVIAEYRQALIDFPYRPKTIESSWSMLRAIIRRMTKPETGSPRGLAIIDLVPWMKPVKAVHRLPRRVTMDDMSLWYIACHVAEFPKQAGFPPADYWRCLIVVAYFSGLRKGDLFDMRMRDIDFAQQELHFMAEKTWKEMILPLHDCVIEHIKRISNGREFVLPKMKKGGGDFSHQWRKIADQAGVDHFTLNDIRRTACSEIDAVESGMGSTLLQHRPMGVTGQFYLNKIPELRKCIDQMAVPISFKHGPRQADRRAIKARKKREAMMRDSEWRPPTKPEVAEWKFPEQARNQTWSDFWFRGEWYAIGKTQGKFLRALALAEGPVDVHALADVFYVDRKRPDDFYHVQGRVCDVLSNLRVTLRDRFEMPKGWNPVPCTERGKGGKWTLLLPETAGEGGAAK